MKLRILCSRPGFRRAGVAHPADKTWPADAFTEEQLEQLRAEPLLTVIEVEAGSPQGNEPSQISVNTEATGIAPGSQHGAAGNQTGAGQESQGGSSSGASDEASKGAEGNSTAPSAPAKNTKPKAVKATAKK
ncbi:HI1506-related protein [Microvirga terricola]|uniref:Mu-like prophage FluMu N-terminal domain-containing protein n=1 Tax=Microvirga terricola TaxID=2719797 RepID=A0ABX0V9M9_9HYPH|nr:HI1506-related protein [Microvirga terricola]NIX75390.1 hypothetical protein [Microvirga terricola]